jgi:hypothetical protein
MGKFKNESYNAWKICVLCNEPIRPQKLANGHFWEGGNNPSPLAESGACCLKCNDLVIAERMRRHFLSDKKE